MKMVNGKKLIKFGKAEIEMDNLVKIIVAVVILIILIVIITVYIHGELGNQSNRLSSAFNFF